MIRSKLLLAVGLGATLWIMSLRLCEILVLSL